jgi:RHS repeat-associated protein
VSATYPDLDNFNRVVHSRWERYAVSSTDFYSVDLGYDRNSNIVTAEDNVHVGFDVKYTMDDVDRLVEAKEGTLSAGAITSPTRDQQWTLSHTGNWDLNKVDLNGDLDFADTDEENDTRAHNAVNEITTRLSGGKTLVYDAVGNLTDDDTDYEYEWDAFYRLRKVKKTSNQALVAEYRYNGLGHRIGEHADTDTDGDVDGSDLWYYDAFDENWRQVARFRSSDTSPKEQFVAHQAGLDGRGGSSYIDLVACRNKDADTSWTSASDTVLEERVYYCQNWRADVSALVKSDGKMLEWVKYSAYGIPFGMPNGDSDSDGDCDSADSTQISAWSGVSYDVRGDIDLDGDVDSTDVGLLQTGVAAGTAVVSGTGVTNSRGHGGRVWTSIRMCDARRRISSPVLGQWPSRDPLIYQDALNAYLLCLDSPLMYHDPSGLSSAPIGPSSYQVRSTSHARASVDGPMPPEAPPTGTIGPTTEEDCCTMARFYARSHPGLIKTRAQWTCCNGQPVICLIEPWNGPFEDVNAHINECMIKHEMGHEAAGDIRHPGGTPCAGIPSGRAVPWNPDYGDQEKKDAEEREIRAEARCVNDPSCCASGAGGVDTSCTDETTARESELDRYREALPLLYPGAH